MAHADFSLPDELHTDISHLGLDIQDGHKRVIAYVSTLWSETMKITVPLY